MRTNDKSVIRQLILITWIIIVGMVMTSCDLAKLIVQKNKSGKTVRLTWTFEIDSLSNNTNIRKLRTSTYTLGTKKGEREVTIIFGFGNWPTKEIERFAENDVKLIEITGVKTKLKLTDKEEIKKFLLERRHGLLKNFITIKVY